MNNGQFLNNMPNADKDGINAGVNIGNVNALKNTDVGVLRNKKDKNKSKYTRTTKPDGTVVETIKMNKDNSSKGIVDVNTDGVNVDNIGVKAGIGEKSQEDAVAFVDSIWGSKQAAGKNADRRTLEAQNDLAEFRKTREQQMQADNEKRKSKQQRMSM